MKERMIKKPVLADREKLVALAEATDPAMTEGERPNSPLIAWGKRFCFSADGEVVQIQRVRRSTGGAMVCTLLARDPEWHPAGKAKG